MSKEQVPIDITHFPELARLAEEVQASHIPRLLRRGERVIARIVPASPIRATLPRPRVRRVIPAEDRDAFLAAAGSWKDVDAEQLKHDMNEARGSDREFRAL